MFDIGWGDFLVLVVAALFVLGPDRLPGAAAVAGRTVRQVREYVGKAQEQLRSEVGSNLGTDFDELRKPLQDLRRLRNVDPRGMITKHLLDATGGYDPRDDLRIDLPGKPIPDFPVPAPAVVQRPLGVGESAPFDVDAT
jgi:sec-independent protein translocase protein TatB